ncbi:uncharacterized protein LOC135474979 [Liolophura sinensis]|uniref:uncharacterized protein LOC135474979 n=1 Tax=Liolophura sinensis TaxID=3198878 RepID=UPI003158765C
MVKRELTEEAGHSTQLNSVSLQTIGHQHVKTDPFLYSFVETELERPHALLMGETRFLDQLHGNQSPCIKDSSADNCGGNFPSCPESAIYEDSKECVLSEQQATTPDVGVVVNTGVDSYQRALYRSARYQPVVKLERNPHVDHMISVKVSPASILVIGEMSHGDQNLQVKGERGFKFWSIADTFGEAQGVFGDKITNQNLADADIALSGSEVDPTLSFVKEEVSHEEQNRQVKGEPGLEWPPGDTFTEAQRVSGDRITNWACDIAIQETMFSDWGGELNSFEEGSMGAKYWHVVKLENIPDADIALSGSEVVSTLSFVKEEVSHEECSLQVKGESGLEWPTGDTFAEAQRVSVDRILNQEIPDANVALSGSEVDPTLCFVKEEMSHEECSLQVRGESGLEWPTGDTFAEAQRVSVDRILNQEIPDANVALSGSEVDPTLCFVKEEMSHEECSLQVKGESGLEWPTGDTFAEAQRVSVDRILNQKIPDANVALSGSEVDPTFSFFKVEVSHEERNLQVKGEPGLEWPTRDTFAEAQRVSGDFHQEKVNDGSEFQVMLDASTETQEQSGYWVDDTEAALETVPLKTGVLTCGDSNESVRNLPGLKLKSIHKRNGVLRHVKSKAPDTCDLDTEEMRTKSCLDGYSSAKYQPVVMLERIPTYTCSTPDVEMCPSFNGTFSDSCHAPGFKTSRGDTCTLRPYNIANFQPVVRLQNIHISAPDVGLLSSEICPTFSENVSRESLQREPETEGQINKICQDTQITSTVYQPEASKEESPALKTCKRGYP